MPCPGKYYIEKKYAMDFVHIKKRKVRTPSVRFLPPADRQAGYIGPLPDFPAFCPSPVHFFMLILRCDPAH
jgi:hypothetical protein